MANEWVEDRFGSLVRYVSEKSRAKDANIDTYISTENMLADFGGITSASTLPLSGSVTRFKAGDTLFSNIRTYFKKVWQAKFDGCCSNDVLVFRPANTETLLPDYLHQICRWEKFTELSIRTSKGAKMPRGDKDALANFKLKIPPIEEQRAIARILGTLDEKIELNRRANETLEAMAQALFKAWFVDFQPVRAKLEGRWQRGQSLTGLPAHLYDLFPDRLVASDSEGIPEGWKTLPVYDIATYVNGAAFKAFQPNDDRRGLPIIKIAELKAGVTDQTKFSDVVMPEKYRLRTGDILFSWSGNPDTSIDTFIWPHGDAWLNQHIFRVDAHSPGERAFVVATLKYLRPAFAEIARNKQTTGLGHVTVGDMQRLHVMKPDGQVLAAWDRVAAPIFAATFGNEIDSISLGRLRDTLLPKLISGELRVADAERFLGEVS